VPLHPAGDGSRDHPLFLHLTELLGARGIAVVRFNRRSAARGHDVPLAEQASDARAVMDRLRERTQVPVGVWGFSQGAWEAAPCWPDMDFDPREAIARARCPVLAFWSWVDEWVPLDPSIARWRPAGPLTIIRLSDATHEPSPGPVYERELCRFLDAL
jgi:alpha/beta superfamily hydrolase